MKFLGYYINTGKIELHVKKEMEVHKYQAFNRTAKVSSKHNLARLRSQRYD